jgi:hypothetical protein
VKKGCGRMTRFVRMKGGMDNRGQRRRKEEEEAH